MTDIKLALLLIACLILAAWFLRNVGTKQAKKTRQ
jgi:hypothetical protein